MKTIFFRALFLSAVVGIGVSASVSHAFTPSKNYDAVRDAVNNAASADTETEITKTPYTSSRRISGVGTIGSVVGKSCERTKNEYLCMMCNCMRESANEPLAGKIMVGLVVKTRVEDSRWPDNICDVIYQPYQFSWTIQRSDRVRALPRSANDPSLRECHTATVETINAPGNGIDHYHATYVKPKWRFACKSPKKIGLHLFYDCPSGYSGAKRTRRSNSQTEGTR